MAKMTFNMMDYTDNLITIRDNSRGMCKRAVYEGAKEALEEIRKAVEALPEERHNSKTEMMYGVTDIEKDGLLDGLGATDMQDEKGVVYTKIGFTGYNGLQTKKYPKGQPNAMIARSICKGTSFRKRIPFVDKAVKKDVIENAIRVSFDSDLKKINK